MRRFTELFCELDQTTRTNEKVAALEKYFHSVPPADAAWALQFLCGRTLPRAVPTIQLWHWLAEESALPEWLIDECYEAVGDGAETMALLLPGAVEGTQRSLAEIVTQRLLPLATLPDHARHDLLIKTWRELNEAQRFVWNKLITGNFRVGVARTLVIRALASVAGVDQAVMAHRVLGNWKPTPEDFQGLLSADPTDTQHARPYPFFLASPVEIKFKRGETLEDLGDVHEWQAEWKWDGIRAQLIRRGGETLIWSRGDEMVTESFPELVEAGNALAEGTVLDGEILAWRGDAPPPFAILQRRLGRRMVGAKIRKEFPVAFLAYDLLELGGDDFRTKPLAERRRLLVEQVELAAKKDADVARTSQPGLECPLLPGFGEAEKEAQIEKPTLKISPVISANSWDELKTFQQQSRARGVEGLMLKKLGSTYGVGRQQGDWWKWKIDPFVIDAVLIAAQRGHGRRASLYTDYTFGVWDNGQLVPVAKAYSGLTDEEILQVDAFVRGHTLDKFGPVRSVKPEQVFELAFEGVQESTRHKSGVAVRFPRMNRWRHDKKPEDADTLESLRSLAQNTVNKG